MTSEERDLEEIEELKATVTSLKASLAEKEKEISGYCVEQDEYLAEILMQGRCKGTM